MSATDELRRMLDERGVEWREWTKKGKRGFTGTETIWFVPYSLIGSDEPGGFFAKASSSGRHIHLKSIVASPEQAIAATLGSDRETELIRAIEDVLRHSTDTVWVGEAETLVDRMVALGVYGQDVYKGARPWEVKR